MKVIEKDTIGEAWQAAYNFIRANGTEFYDEDKKILEFLQLFLIIHNPNETDPIVDEQKDDMGEWMRDNFTKIKRVPELNDAWSYGWRLYDFQGVNQIEWVIDKFKAKPESKSATISMLQKAGSEGYVPCVSLLDFKIRDKKLWLTVTCRSLDIGKKAVHNLSNLASIAKKVADALEIKDTKLQVHIISAHIYEEDL